MDKKQLIIEYCKEAHALTEECYRAHPAGKGSVDWLDKRKYLLADLSLHMVQAALQGDKADVELMKRYLYSILTICDDFLPEAGLSATAATLIEQEGAS